jgi:hypothetical protein
MQVTRLLNFLFGCRHTHLSRVFTIHRHTYRVCCDCGAEFDYSLETMVLQRRRKQPSVPDVVNDMGELTA